MEMGQKHENGTKTHKRDRGDTRRRHARRWMPPTRRREPSLVEPVLLIYTAVGRDLS